LKGTSEGHLVSPCNRGSFAIR